MQESTLISLVIAHAKQLADMPMRRLRDYVGTGETVHDRFVETQGLSRGELVKLALESLYVGAMAD